MLASKVPEFEMKVGCFDWEGFVGDDTLSQDEVHVWRIGSETTAAEFGKLLRVLSQDERERADRFRFEADRRRAVIGRAYLRLLIAEIVRLPADQLQFAYNDFGKPELVSVQARVLQFNVSHSGELILIAIAVGRDVGVDVERIRTGFDVEEVAERFFSDREREVLASLDGHAKTEAFFKLWTLKEAYLKAKGSGLSAPLNQFDVFYATETAPTLTATHSDPDEAGEWTLQPLSVPAGYAAALAARGASWRLKYWSRPWRLLSNLSI
jgi:4'-phosphopantetheinyl transferase